MLTAIALVCVLGLPCDAAHARDVVRSHEVFSSPTTCYMHAQAMLASTEMGRHRAPDERFMPKCIRQGRFDGDR